MSWEWSIRELAVIQLGIEDEDRLDEIDELAGLLEMIRDSMPTRFEGEVPPALQFQPGSRSPDFWHGMETRHD
ncbi:MAG: hypothetical protein WD354_08165 [Acidimicrobiia bacterium]